MESLNLDLINHFFIHYPIFTISIAFSGVIATTIYLFAFGRFLGQQATRRRMQHKIDHMKQHYIICGYGRVGEQVAKELAAENEPFIIIERDEEKLKGATDVHWPTLLGDVALDEGLFEKARIEEAKAVIIAVGSDADAIFMAVSARALKKDVFIVARASSVEAADKLTKIGVNRIALPYQIGGYHMATMALRPTVVDFLDLLVDQEREELEMEEYFISEAGPYDGKTVANLGKPEILAVVAIRKKSGKAVINPGDNQKLEGGDRLVILGPKSDLEALTKVIDKAQTTKGKPDGVMADLPKDVHPSPFQKENA